MSQPISLALIGAGAIGRIHAANIAANPRARLSHICDLNADAATELAVKYNSEPATSVKDVLEQKPDGVIIASATASHEVVAKACIAAGIPFLCEKPLAADAKSAEDIVRSASSAGLVAATAFNRRFDDGYLQIRNAAATGKIGRLESISMVSRTVAAPSPEFIATSGGLFGEKGSHFYDLARWICGEDPVELFAMGSVLIDPDFAKLGEFDTAKIVLRMQSGTLCQLDFSWRAAYGQDERVEVTGSKGMLQTMQQPVGPVLRTDDNGVLHSGKMPTWQKRFAATYVRELNAFLKSLETGALHDLPTLADGLAAQRIAEAVRKSAQDNKPVALKKLTST